MTDKLAKPERGYFNWKEVNAICKDCDLDTAKALLRMEKAGRARREFLRRIQHRVSLLQKRVDMANVLGEE